MKHRLASSDGLMNGSPAVLLAHWQKSNERRPGPRPSDAQARQCVQPRLEPSISPNSSPPMVSASRPAPSPSNTTEVSPWSRGSTRSAAIEAERAEHDVDEEHGRATRRRRCRRRSGNRRRGARPPWTSPIAGPKALKALRIISRGKCAS